MKEPRKIYFEGKFVGEVPDTGDQQADMKAATALLNAKGVQAAHATTGRLQASIGVRAQRAASLQHRSYWNSAAQSDELDTIRG
jgi:hypothetical protein